MPCTAEQSSLTTEGPARQGGGMTTQHSSSRDILHSADEILPRTVSIQDPAELIAYVRHTLGFAPTSSIVGMAMTGHALGPVLRCDIPAPFLNVLGNEATSDQPNADLEAFSRRFGQYIAEQLRNDPTADRTLLIFFSDDAAKTTSLLTIDRSLRDGFGDRALPTFESWLVNNDQLWHLHCPTAECDTQGRDVSNVDHTLVGDSLTLLGSSVCNEQPTDELPLPPADTIRQDQVETLDPDDVEACWDWISQWDAILDQDQSLTDHQARRLAAPLRWRSWRDLLIISTGFNVDTAISGLGYLGVVPPELLAVAGVESDEACADCCAEALVGSTNRRPAWDRLGRLRSMCDRVLPHARGEAVAALASIAVWIEWARGRGSAAAHLLDQALAVDPDYSLTELMERAIRTGLICRWALDRETAWSASPYSRV